MLDKILDIFRVRKTAVISGGAVALSECAC